MGAKSGRLEARYTLASNWTAEFSTVSTGAFTVTITAGNYYPLELIAAISAQIDGQEDLGITISDGETGTGCVTIWNSGATFSVTWTSTDLRDALGYTGNLASGTAAQTSTRAVQGLWIAGVGKFSLHGDSDNGRLVTTFRSTVGPTGTVHALYGSSFRRHDEIRWEGVAAARAKEHHESVTQESFESFFRAAALGRYSYIPVNAYVRLYWDADVDGTYVVGRLLWPPELDLRTMISGWTGRYVINLPPLVVES